MNARTSACSYGYLCLKISLFTRAFKARGINYPIPFLRTNGFSHNFAVKIKNNLVKRINPGDLEKLCVHLRCTPNDLIEWVPDNEYDIDEDHPLNQIKQTEKIIDLTRTLNSVPLQFLPDIEDMIEEKVKDLMSKGKQDRG